jgi:CDP-diacylglycerol--glycerol-3-phosphate 3-phosphatidyltransferase
VSESENVDAGWLTWANAITLVRLALLPVFFWILFSTNHWAIAAWLLGVLGATDWIDGFVARRLHQVSTVGKILDPTADRILVIGGLLAVAVVGAVPWWFALATLVREVIVSTFPLFLLTSNPHHAPLQTWQHVGRDACWVIGIMGLTLSWIVLAGYVKPALRALRDGRQARRIL